MARTSKTPQMYIKTGGWVYLNPAAREALGLDDGDHIRYDRFGNNIRIEKCSLTVPGAVPVYKHGAAQRFGIRAQIPELTRFLLTFVKKRKIKSGFSATIPLVAKGENLLL